MNGLLLLVFLPFGFFSVLVSAFPSEIVQTPRSSENIYPRSVTPLSSSKLDGFAPYTQLARAAYCNPSKIRNWGCGQACKAIPDFQPTLVGGDGGIVQYYFVGYWPSQNTVVVGHQGTDPVKCLGVLTDTRILLRPLNPDIFPGIPSNVSVHQGFADQHEITAPAILAEVKRLIEATGATTVTLVGHSLGGALSQLDALSMALNLPSNIHIKVVTYGLPRSGNPAYAEFYDSKVIDSVRINNERDVIPIIPGRGLGFQHTSGEIHIISPNNAVACPGRDDAVDPQCTISTVPNIAAGFLLDHLGPYQGILIGTIFCY